MKANDKHDAIDALLSLATGGKDRYEVVRNGECMTCDSQGNVSSSFSDDLSRKEYSISGMCQSCQDDIFGAGEPNDEDNPDLEY
tara:strand:- start:434 stop:685 length:252 start_codon:yes stop_codon:yes gene_type:complete